MPVTWTEEGRTLVGQVSGELDHHRARLVMEELDREIDLVLPTRLTLDLKDLTFTDSSGIAVLLRAYRRVGRAGGALRVVNIPRQARRVFAAAGLQRLIPFSPEDKEDIP